MDPVYFSCPVTSQDVPRHVTFTVRPCGYSHNLLEVQALDTQGVVVPPWEVGVCVRPINVTRLGVNIDVKNLTRWLEFWRMNGVGDIHLYVSHASGAYQQLFEEYQREKFNLLRVVHWDKVERDTEVVVSDEAAVNHCLHKNMMRNRYILITSYDNVLLFNSRFKNLKQFLRDTEVQDRFSKFAGFRILPVEKTNGMSERPTMLVKSRHILATAAIHFIPLNGRSTFKILDPLDVAAAPLTKMVQQDSNLGMDQYLSLAAYKVLKNIGISGVV